MAECSLCGKENLLGYETVTLCKECASKSSELAATVPPVGAANNRSDEIADMLEGAIKLVAQERWEGAGALIGQAILQLRAVR